MPYCTTCGGEISAHAAKFCAACGTPVVSVPSRPAPIQSTDANGPTLRSTTPQSSAPPASAETTGVQRPADAAHQIFGGPIPSADEHLNAFFWLAAFTPLLVGIAVLAAARPAPPLIVGATVQALLVIWVLCDYMALKKWNQEDGMLVLAAVLFPPIYFFLRTKRTALRFSTAVLVVLTWGPAWLVNSDAYLSRFSSTPTVTPTLQQSPTESRMPVLASAPQTQTVGQTPEQAPSLVKKLRDAAERGDLESQLYWAYTLHEPQSSDANEVVRDDFEAYKWALIVAGRTREGEAFEMATKFAEQIAPTLTKEQSDEATRRAIAWISAYNQRTK